MRRVILCVAGWRNQSSQASFGRAPSHPYLGSIIGIRATFFFLVEVGTTMVLSLEAKDGTIVEAGSTSWSYGRWILIFTKMHKSGTKSFISKHFFWCHHGHWSTTLHAISKIVTFFKNSTLFFLNQNQLGPNQRLHAWLLPNQPD